MIALPMTENSFPRHGQQNNGSAPTLDRHTSPPAASLHTPPPLIRACFVEQSLADSKQSTKQQLLSGYDNSDINKRSLEEEAATAAAEAVDTAQGSPELPTAARVNAKVQPETPKVTTPSVEGTGTEGRALDAAAAAAVGAEGVDARVGGRAVAEKDRLSAALQLLGLSEGFELDGKRRARGCCDLFGSACVRLLCVRLLSFCCLIVSRVFCGSLWSRACFVLMPRC